MRFETNLMVASINPRREKAGEENGSLGMDIGLTTELNIKDLATLLKDEHAVALLDHLYDGDGNLQTLDIDKITFATEHKNVRVTLRAGNETIKFDDAELNDISVKPALNRVVDFKARQQVHPTSKQLAWVADLLKEKVRLIAETRQTELPLTTKGKANGKAAGQEARA